MWSLPLQFPLRLRSSLASWRRHWIENVTFDIMWTQELTVWGTSAIYSSHYPATHTVWINPIGGWQQAMPSGPCQIKQEDFSHCWTIRTRASGHRSMVKQGLRQRNFQKLSYLETLSFKGIERRQEDKTGQWQRCPYMLLNGELSLNI